MTEKVKLIPFDEGQPPLDELPTRYNLPAIKHSTCLRCHHICLSVEQYCSGCKAEMAELEREETYYLPTTHPLESNKLEFNGYLIGAAILCFVLLLILFGESLLILQLN